MSGKAAKSGGTTAGGKGAGAGGTAASGAGGKIPLLDLARQWEGLEAEVLPEVAAVFRENDFILGKRVEALEAEIAAYCRVPYAVAVANGTDAILLALKCVSVATGGEVITSAFTFFATAGAVWNCGARPVFADIEPDTFNIDPMAVAAALTRRTRAILPVHLFGRCAAMGPLLQISVKTGIPVVEDAAQAIGAEYRGMRAGSIGDAGTLSFYPSKNLGGAGDGGMVVTHRKDLADLLRMARNHGSKDRYFHEFVGTNSRLDGLQGAVLRAKLKRLESWHAARRERAARYDEELRGVPGIRTPSPDPQGRHVYNQYTLRCEKRDALKDHLASLGIGAAVYYSVPLHMQKCFRSLGYRQGQFPHSERAANEVLSIPIFPELTGAEQGRVIEAIRGFHGAK
jgi:dTDP-4-amino-4,6-dideoxygalactose transaminase